MNESSCLRVKRAYGAFHRSFSPAKTVDTRATVASYTDGVLRRVIQKREETKPRQIKVNLEAAAAAK